MTSPWLLAQAWLEFIYIDVVSLFGFRAVRWAVAGTRTRSRSSRTDDPAAVIAAAKMACALYIKPAKCLQRSAVTTRLLRRRGVPAAMVIGCRIPPLEAHAWVEVSGEVVSDYRSGLEFYRVLDRW